MAILRIRTAPDPILQKKVRRVAKFDAALQRLIDDMFETMYDAHGVGLAANQVGVSLRLFVLGIPRHEEEEEGVEAGIDEYVFINAEWVKKVGERELEEGCLSIPGYRGRVKRSEWVKVKGLDRDGKAIRMRGDGLLAQAFEHEIDHLDGILYVDRMKEQGLLDTLRELPAGEPVEAAAG